MTIQERKWLEALMSKRLEDKVTAKQQAEILKMMWESFTEMDDVEASIEENGGDDRYLRTFLQAKKIEGRSEKTLKRYEYVIKRFLKKEKITSASVTVSHLRDFYATELERGTCENTIRGYQDVFSSYYGWLWREGLIQSNPCNNMGTIKVPKFQKKAFTSVEIERIKENCETVRDKAIVCFLLSSGCRIEETTRLNRNDIDFVNKECTVYGKGQKERIVYIDDVAAELLKKYLKERKDDSIALFSGKGSERMTPGGIRSMLKRIEKRSGVADIHPHRFRRTLATSLARRGMSIQEVAELLGHEKVTTTMKYVCVEQAAVKHHYQTIVA